MKPKKLSLQESLFFYLCSDKLWGLLTVGEDKRYNGGEFKKVILMVSKALLERMKSEIEGDKRTYLENCVNN